MASSSGSDTTTLLLGRYRVEATLGEGSFGTVVRAFDTRLKRTVAIKTLKRSLASTDMDQFRALEERFAREAEAGSRMGIHPNLVTVHDLVIEPDHTQYLILEFVRGGTLADRMREGALPLHEALRTAADVARGLQAAHDVGIVHRDIKPANVFLAPDGRAQVGDFGIAQIDDVSGRTHTEVRHPGTPLYMSPEQAQTTGYVRPASDQYSLGLVLFEMLTGKAYKRIGARAASELIERQQISVANLVEDMIATDPDDRHPSCEHVIRRIQVIAREQGLTETQLAVERADSAAIHAAALPPDTVLDSQASSSLPPGVVLYTGQLAPPSATGSTRSLPDATVESGAASGSGSRAHEVIYPSNQPDAAHVAHVAPLAGAAHLGHPPPPGALADVGRGGIAPKPSHRIRRIVIACAAAVILLAVGMMAAFALRSGTISPQVTATAQPLAATTAPVATVAPSATPSPTTAPTIPATAVPAQTTAPSVTTPARTATPVAGASTIAVRSVGTTDQQLDIVNGDDVKPSFTVGQDVYGFVNFGGALVGKDILDVTLTKNGAPQQPQHFTLDKSDGFLVFPLGKLDVADYQLIVSYNGKIAKTWDFKVAPQPTAVPRPPTATPRPITGGATVAPTATTPQPTTALRPTTTPQPTTAPRPTIPPTQPVPTA